MGKPTGFLEIERRERGYDREVVRQYRLGWAPDGWSELVNALKLPPARSSCSRLMVARTLAACSPPMTEVLALGH